MGMKFRHRASPAEAREAFCGGASRHRKFATAAGGRCRETEGFVPAEVCLLQVLLVASCRPLCLPTLSLDLPFVERGGRRNFSTRAVVGLAWARPVLIPNRLDFVSQSQNPAAPIVSLLGSPRGVLRAPLACFVLLL
ncbi:unnamed protein product, partial [Hapterophycus canaliculatus]